MTHVDTGEVRLIQQATQGDSTAFGDLFEQHYEGVYQYCLRLTGDAHAAEDVTQEAFIQAHRNLHRFGAPWRLRPWLYQIARNTFLMQTRRDSPESALDTDVPLGGPGPEQQVISGETSVLVRHALDRLSPHYRDVLMLREIDGFPYSDIAEIMGISLDNVRVLIHRARASFRESYFVRVLSADLLPRCDVLKDRLDAMHDGEALGEQDQVVRNHLKTCAACQQRRHEMIATGSLLSALPQPAIPPALHKKLDGQKQKNTPRDAERPHSNSGQRGGSTLRTWVGLGIAAVLIIGLVIGARIAEDQISSIPRLVPQTEEPGASSKRDAPDTPTPTTTPTATASFSGQPAGPVTTTQVFPVFDCTHLGNNIFEWYEVEVTYKDDVPVSKEVLSGPHSGIWQPGCPAGEPASSEDDGGDGDGGGNNGGGGSPPTVDPCAGASCGDGVCSCGELPSTCPGDCVIIP